MNKAFKSEVFENLPLQVAILTEEVKAVKVLLLEMKNMQVDGEKVIGMYEVSKLTGYAKNTIYHVYEFWLKLQKY
jgi:hypothetical protein